MDVNTADRRYLERSLALKAAAQHLTPRDYADWRLYGFTHRSLCHYNKVFAVWRQTPEGPVVIDSITVTEISVDSIDGFAVRIRNAAGEHQWLCHKPDRLFHLPVFAHIPFMPDITFLPRQEKGDIESMQLKFPIVYKTAGNPDRLVNGLVYLTQVGEFRSTYPQFADLRL